MDNEPNNESSKPIEAQKLTEKELEGVVGATAAAALFATVG